MRGSPAPVRFAPSGYGVHICRVMVALLWTRRGPPPPLGPRNNGGCASNIVPRPGMYGAAIAVPDCGSYPPGTVEMIDTPGAHTATSGPKQVNVGEKMPSGATMRALTCE